MDLLMSRIYKKKKKKVNMKVLAYNPKANGTQTGYPWGLLYRQCSTTGQTQVQYETILEIKLERN